MDNIKQRLIELYESNKNTHFPVKLVLKEPAILNPFCPKVKVDKEYDENGRLCRYRLTRKPKKEFKLYLYKSTSGEICFSNKSSRVSRVYSHYVLFKDSQVESIELIKNESKDNRDWATKNRDYIVKNIHDNIWQSLKERLMQDDFREDGLIKENSYEKVKTVSMKSVFPKWVVDSIKDAIENKKNFSYRLNGTRRDKSVEVKVELNGDARAWYSSEYAGCLNGAYYLLINPNTAVFCEYD